MVVTDFFFPREESSRTRVGSPLDGFFFLGGAASAAAAAPVVDGAPAAAGVPAAAAAAAAASSSPPGVLAAAPSPMLREATASAAASPLDWAAFHLERESLRRSKERLRVYQSLFASSSFARLSLSLSLLPLSSRRHFYLLYSSQLLGRYSLNSAGMPVTASYSTASGGGGGGLSASASASAGSATTAAIVCSLTSFRERTQQRFRVWIVRERSRFCRGETESERQRESAQGANRAVRLVIREERISFHRPRSSRRCFIFHLRTLSRLPLRFIPSRPLRPARARERERERQRDREK